MVMGFLAYGDSGQDTWTPWPNRENEGRVTSSFFVVSLHAAGGEHTCALTESGVRCWGDDEYGQINVLQDLKNPRALAAGG